MKKYSWKPDLPDQRDYAFATLAKSFKLSPPATMDLRNKCSAVEDQGQLGSCTANALAGAIEYNENMASTKFVDLSRLFIYWNARSIEGTVNYDSGCAIRDGIKSLVARGVCKETTWPYNVSKFRVKPSNTCFSEAIGFRISNYYRVNSSDVNQLRLALANKTPFVFGFSVYDAFESTAVAATGVLNMPAPGERLLGGHAVMAVGYNDATQRFLVRNSWGPRWGQSGYFTMPYAYVTDTNLADDFWVIVK